MQSMFFRHCDKPALTPIDGIVTGSIPKWLEGTLLRNGPGIQEFGPDKYNHTFDGLAVIHRFHVANGKVTYNNRPLESDVYKLNAAAGRIVTSQFGTGVMLDPCDAIFSQYKTEFEAVKSGSDNCAVSVGFYGDQLYAMTENTFTRRIDPVSLEPIGPKTVISDYVAINSATAHPHVLPNGNVVNLGHHYSHKNGPHYAIFEVPPKFNTEETSFTDAKRLCEIPVTEKMFPSYLHSFGLAQDKVVLVESPFKFNISKMHDVKSGKTSFLDLLGWHDDKKTRFLIASTKTGDVHPIVYETDNLFTFHHANAYEEDGFLIVDVAGYDTAKYVTDNLTRDTIHTVFEIKNDSSFRRYVLPLNVIQGATGNLVTLKNCSATATLRSGTTNVVDVTPQILYKGWLEFPRINYKFNGLKNRFTYAVGVSQPNGEISSMPEANLLIKVDAETGNNLIWTEKNLKPAEPIFVANPTIENPAEDDGVVVMPMLHRDDEHKVTLLILDAKKWKEVGRAVFHTDGVVPGEFHGQWANAKDKIHLF